jgi:hypothetical protein
MINNSSQCSNILKQKKIIRAKKENQKEEKYKVRKRKDAVLIWIKR